MGALGTNDDRKIAWVGGYPAHYTRIFHRALEVRFPGEIEFIYVGNSHSERAYEQGGLPKSAVILTGSVSWKLLQQLFKLNPRSVIVAGHYPRPLFYAVLWGFYMRRDVLYWADTNLLDIFFKSKGLLWLRRLILKAYFRRMHSLLYTGVRTRDYYVWACGRQVAKTKLKWLPYPQYISQSIDDRARQENRSSFLQILFVGRLAPEKAVDELIRGFALLSPEIRARTRLRIAGDGPEKPMIEKLVGDLNLGDAVEILGAVPSDQTVHLFNEAFVFVLPSHREPWGVVVSEAMAAGLPVIAPFWVGAVADLVLNGHTGIVIDDNSPVEIARAIEYFVNNPAEAKRMGGAARAVIEIGKWSSDGTVNAFARIIAGLKERT